MKDKLKEIEDATQTKEDEDFGKGKEKVLEDEISQPDPPLGEKEPFLKSRKVFGGKSLENVSICHGKMDVEVVLEWIESIENYFECEGTIEAQKVRFKKSRLKGQALTWWSFVQEARESEGKNPIAKWKGIVEKIKETYL